MLELATGTGLAMAAGLNAWVPLLGLGLLSRHTDLVALPGGWSWLENGWVLTVLGVLLLIEVLADKVPVLDSFNDAVQTVVRPTSGGIAFGAGATSETVTVQDPGTFVSSGQWLPVVLGIVLALVVHLVKATARVVSNASTGGAAAPALSTAEDVGAVALSALAVLLPVLVVVALLGLGVAGFLVVRASRRRRAARAARASG
ncbi:DUF4126 domain-containing protein [Xylanimonas oleitrophica]|uniref:DUF4126 domain-containing protein n=1 Tax=Xylanimonas oleitrophica TaxID=2607479 RepID=A0A2W5WXC8_9MICO|nr:DUF4126 domain-containing protein [Xylanimonas oleitrophica]PZR55333.1 DUF4126 domain-containing protein [Xylanimonas oleitrophica]